MQSVVTVVLISAAFSSLHDSRYFGRLFILFLVFCFQIHSCVFGLNFSLEKKSPDLLFLIITPLVHCCRAYFCCDRVSLGTLERCRKCVRDYLSVAIFMLGAACFSTFVFVMSRNLYIERVGTPFLDSLLVRGICVGP